MANRTRNTERIELELPPEIVGPLRAEAARVGGVKALVVRLLARRYKVAYTPPARGRPPKPAPPAAPGG